MNHCIGPKNLKNVPWPDCYKYCATVEYFGVSECDYICNFNYGRKPKRIQRKFKYPIIKEDI